MMTLPIVTIQKQEQHIEMMAAVIAAGQLANPESSLAHQREIVSYSLQAAREIVRQNRESKP